MHIPIIHPGVRVECLAPDEAGNKKAWIDAISRFDAAAGTVLKQDGDTLVCRALLNAPAKRDVIVKRWELSTFASRCKSLLGHSRAFRHWHGAQWLEAHGIPTARCLALLTAYRRAHPRQYLVMEPVQGPTLLELLVGERGGPRSEHAIARSLARQMVAMTLAGRYNRDHKPSNLIIQADGRPAILDTVAINKLRPWRKADLYAMFASLILEPLGCACPPRRSLMMRVLVEHQQELLRHIPDLIPEGLRRAARHNDWMRVAGIVAAHGDPTPRVNPLHSAR